MIDHTIKAILKPTRPLLSFGVNVAAKVLNKKHLRDNEIEITKHNIKVSGLGRKFDGYKVLQLSDIHLGSWMGEEKLQEIVDLTNEQKPDIILITGDFVSYFLVDIPESMQIIMRKLNAKDGVYAVLGNHDYWENTGQIIKDIKKSGINLLTNDVAEIKRGKEKLIVAGVDDILDGKPDLKKVLDKLNDDSPAIIMCHEPDYAIEVTKTKRFFLQLSGHSHGGVITIPGLPTIKGRMFKHFHRGMYDVDGMKLYVNRGVGSHIFRLRINCKPEISIFKLTPGK